MTRYRLGSDFPREGFVQAALEQHFADCQRHAVGHADFACTDADGRQWLIEAKGEPRTSALISGPDLDRSCRGHHHRSGRPPSRCPTPRNLPARERGHRSGPAGRSTFTGSWSTPPASFGSSGRVTDAAGLLYVTAPVRRRNAHDSWPATVGKSSTCGTLPPAMSVRSRSRYGFCPSSTILSTLGETRLAESWTLTSHDRQGD
jgi:hypothetical protein